MMSIEDIAAVNLPEFPDEESCVAHFKAKGHDDATARKMCQQMKKGARKVGFVYQATFKPYEEQGKHLAKIHVIDLAPNKNEWQVTAPARAKALKTLLDAPLLGPPPDGEKGNVIGGPPGSPHEGLWSPVGHFVDFQSNHVTHGIAEITKDYAWEKIKNKEWQAVSPSVLAFVEHREGDMAVVDDFNFEHVLFVDKGAYPEAGVESTCDGDLGSCGCYQALATAAENQARAFSITDKDLSIMEKAVQSARGILTALEERLEIILGSKPDAEPVVPPLPLSSHTTTALGPSVVGNVGTSPSPTQTQVPENEMGQKMEGGNEMNTTQPTTVLQAADAWNTADAPDKFFAFVPEEAKGPDGKKSLRKLPLASVQKKDLDEAIVRDALSRLPQTDGVDKAEALSKICGAAGHLGLDLPSCHKGAGVGEKESVTKMDECKELQAKVTVLEAENTALKAFKAEVEKKARMAKVQTIVDLKTHCGMLEPKDQSQAYVDLEKLSAEALDAIEKELTAIQARLDSMPSGPKAKHTAEQAYNTIEDARERMFGYRRDEHGDIIGGK